MTRSKTKTAETEGTSSASRPNQAVGSRGKSKVARPQEATPEGAAASVSLTEAPRLTKIAQLQGMLRTGDGASLSQLCQATGWQAHTVRAALTRLRQAGYAVERTPSEAGTSVYRIQSKDVREAETTAGAAVADAEEVRRITEGETAQESAEAELGQESTIRPSNEPIGARQEASEATAGKARQDLAAEAPA